MTDDSKLEMSLDENRLLKNRIKELENALNSSNTEFIEPAKDSALLTDDYFSIMSRDYIYRILIENMNEGALIVSEQKIIVYSNKHFANIIDLPLQKTMGGDFCSLFDENERIMLQECFQTAETGKAYREVIITTKSQRKIPVLVSIISFLLEEKRYYCVIVNDISDHTEVKLGLETQIEQQMQELAVANKRLAEVNRELKEANHYLDNMVHSIAHDLRSPLSNLMLVDELLQVASDHQRDKLMKTVHKNVHKLDKIIRGLVEILRVQGVKEKNRPGVLVMNVINEVIEEMDYRIKRKDAKITIQGRKDYEINFIEAYLRSIIRNLLSNALKYSKDDEEPEIIIELKKTRRFFILSMEDNGIGIDLEKESKDLFKPFHRITSEGKGMGIGLHIINDMARKNGGRIEVESEPGKGTKFNVFLKEFNS